MADDVTLLPCPMCGGTDIRIARLSASPDQSVWCRSCQLRTKWCYRDDAIAAWNARVPDPRIARIDAAMTFLQERAATEEWADKALVTLAQILLEPPAPGEADARWGAETLAVLKARGLWPTT